MANPKTKQRRVLVCAATGGDGAIERKCSECPATVWISANGQKQMEQAPGTEPLCLRCSSRLICGPRPVVIAMPEAAVNQVLERIRKASLAHRN